MTIKNGDMPATPIDAVAQSNDEWPEYATWADVPDVLKYLAENVGDWRIEDDGCLLIQRILNLLGGYTRAQWQRAVELKPSAEPVNTRNADEQQTILKPACVCGELLVNHKCGISCDEKERRALRQANAVELKPSAEPVKQKLFYWVPGEESELSDEIVKELKWLAQDVCENTAPDTLFSWGEEDNEDCPAIAKYVGTRYNEHKFFIDLRDYLKEKSPEPQEWQNGVPPVGVTHEARHINWDENWANPEWTAKVITAHGEKMFLTKSTKEDTREGAGFYCDWLFRPIQTKEQREAEVLEIVRVIREFDMMVDVHTNDASQLAGLIYDAGYRLVEHKDGE